MTRLKQTWYREWFNSEYYDLLYEHRDQVEAKLFIANLFNHLKLDQDIKVLDLACGKGRHSIQVHDLGYEVIGLDLSEESIKYAQQFQGQGIHFQSGDMRNIPFTNKFDLVLNLFTSFGYFEEESENIEVIRSIANALKTDGMLVLDFMNIHKVIREIPNEETVQRNKVHFEIRKYLDDGAIVKDIRYKVDGKEQNQLELVKLIDLPLFQSYFDEAGLELKDVFGDYHFNAFDPEQSDRLIMIAQKPKL